MATTSEDRFSGRLADLMAEAIDALAEAGFLPADEDDYSTDAAEALGAPFPRWIADRYFAARPFDGGWAVAHVNAEDERLTVWLCTDSGVVRHDPFTFIIGDLGASLLAAMFTTTEA